MPFQLCSDSTEATELCERYRLYLKPVWKIKISVQLPALKTPGQAISSWEVMEKLRNMIKPEQFISLKVSKTNLVLIQFEGEVEKKSSFKKVLQKVQSNNMKLSGFSDVLKIRSAPAKLNYPTRHDWDSFFRDAKNIDEMKPGERPDTVYIQDLPTEWFAEDSVDKPSEYVLKKVFEAFGDIRQVAIPSLDITSADQTFGKVSNLNRDRVFDAYIQYKEYISFVKAMDSLKAMKLLRKCDGGKVYTADIKVDFDRTRYLSEKSIWRRTMEQKLLAERKITEEAKKCTPPVVIKKEEEPKRKPEEPVQERGSKHSAHDAKAERRKEAKYLLKALLHRAEASELEKRAKKQEQQIMEEKIHQQRLLEKAREEEENRKAQELRAKRKYLQEQEKQLREKLLKSLKAKEQRRTEEIREKLRKEISGRKVLKSVLVVLDKKNTSDRSYRAAKRLKL